MELMQAKKESEDQIEMDQIALDSTRGKKKKEKAQSKLDSFKKELENLQDKEVEVRRTIQYSLSFEKMTRG